MNDSKFAITGLREELPEMRGVTVLWYSNWMVSNQRSHCWVVFKLDGQQPEESA